MNIGEVRQLYYREGLSAREVGERLGKSVWQVIKFMRKNQIPRRQASETQRIQFQKRPLSYQKKQRLSQLEYRLHEAGLMLYWAEGVKSGQSTVDLANSDQRMIVLFLRVLREIYRVNEGRLRVLLYCYQNQDVSRLIRFWSGLLNIPKHQFIKPYVRRDFDLNKTNRMPHGLVHIRYNDKRLYSQILEDIDIIVSDLS